MPNYFQLWNSLWLQRDTVDALTLALVSHVGIYLGGFHVLVTEHVLDCVDSRTCIYLQGAEGVTGTMVVKPKINGRQIKAIRNVKRYDSVV